MLGEGKRLMAARSVWVLRCLTVILPLLAARQAPSTPDAPAETPSSIPVRAANWALAAEWMPDRASSRIGSVRVEPQWISGGEAFWYRYRTTEGERFWFVDPERAIRTPLFDHSDLARRLEAVAGQPQDSLSLDLEDLDVLEDPLRIRFRLGNARYEYAPASGSIAFLDSAAAGQDEAAESGGASPDGSSRVFLRGNDLYLLRDADPESLEVRLSRDGTAGYCWGRDWALYDDRDTTPREVEVLWSPDSRLFCVHRADTRRVGDLWLIDHLAQPRPRLRTLKYPMPGDDEIPQWELWVGDAQAGTLVRIETERWPDQDLDDLFQETVWWSRDSKAIYYTRRSRDYRSVDLCAADPATGRSRTVVEERIDGAVYLRPLIQLHETREILWWSMRDGWGHFYLFGSDGELKRQITQGAYNADAICAVDAKDRTLFFEGNGKEPGRNPYYRHIYAVDLDGSEARLLSPEDANHSASFSPSNRYFVDNFSRVDAAPRSVLRRADGSMVLDLETVDLSGFQEAGWRPPEVFTAKGADGATDLWGVLYKPFDFDPSRKYPIVTRVYPGRQGEAIPRSFTPVSAEVILANLGCVVVWFGNRGGTYERGHAYHEFGREAFRDYGLADKSAVIEELGARHSWIDLDRVGIYGGSSGGFMTISAMLVHPDFFKVGVAMTAPNDPSVYYNSWAERYGSLRQVSQGDGSVAWECDADGNLELAGNLRGRLLMIYGEQDDLVHPAHLYRMADALIKAKKRFDMLVIPGGDHGLGGWRYSYRVLWSYFAEHLIGDPPKGVDLETPAGP